jgi:hypothetical protein
MVGPFQAQGPAESDAAVRLPVRSHVPGRRRDRAQVEEAGNRKAELSLRFLPQESADGLSSQGVRPMNRLFSSPCVCKNRVSPLWSCSPRDGENVFECPGFRLTTKEDVRKIAT